MSAAALYWPSSAPCFWPGGSGWLGVALGGLPLVTGSLARLIATAAVNVVAAMALFLLITRSKVVYVRRRY